MEQELLIPRKAVISELSRVRYGNTQKELSPPTFWRWCATVGIPKRTSHFTLEQAQSLTRLALWVKEGGTVEAFLQQRIKEQQS